VIQHEPQKVASLQWTGNNYDFTLSGTVRMMARRVIATQVDSNGFELSGAVPLWLAVWLPHGCQLLTTRIFL
jgi:hypothetical protein